MLSLVSAAEGDWDLVQVVFLGRKRVGHLPEAKLFSLVLPHHFYSSKTRTPGMVAMDANAALIFRAVTKLV